MKRYLAGILTILTIACNGGSDEEITLELNPEAGENYRMTMDMELLMTAMGMETSMEMVIFFDMHINEVVGDTIDITATYSRVKFEQQIPMIGTIEYDSEEDAGDPNEMAQAMSELFGTLVDREFKLKLNRRGEVLSTSGLKDMSTAGSPMTETATSEAQITELVGNLMAYLPDRPVREGDTWGREMERSGQIPIIIESQYRVHRIRNNEVVLKMEGDILHNEESDEAAAVQGLSGNYSGTMTLNRNTGWTESASINQDIEMTITESETTIPMSMKNHIEFSLED